MQKYSSLPLSRMKYGTSYPDKSPAGKNPSFRGWNARHTGEPTDHREKHWAAVRPQ